MKWSGLCFCLLIAFAASEVYFDETFADGSNWESRWVYSTTKGDEAGKFERTAGKYFDTDDKADAYGIQTAESARFYQISSKLLKEFSNKGKSLVIQFSVRHEQNIDCGGGYIKLLPAGLDQTKFDGNSDYNIMFGPDICGSSTKKVHVILNYKGKNHLINKNVRAESDELSHLYTLILRADQTYSVLIDNEEKESGSLTTDWDFLPAKEINDPSAKKPDDWVDEAKIDDPSEVKPADWEEASEYITDPDAKKPEDWDDDLDGEWEAPQIPNPEFKGKWKAKRIDNPAYKGPWVHPKIANPDYFTDENIYSFASNAFVGIEIWQVKAGTIFDNFLVTDDETLAKDRAEQVVARFKREKTVHDAAKEEERKKAEEASKAEQEAREAAAAEEKEDAEPESKDEL